MREDSYNMFGLWALCIPHICQCRPYSPIYSSSPHTHRKRRREAHQNAIRSFTWVLRVEGVGLDRDFISCINFYIIWIFQWIHTNSIKNIFLDWTTTTKKDNSTSIMVTMLLPNGRSVFCLDSKWKLPKRPSTVPTTTTLAEHGVFKEVWEQNFITNKEKEAIGVVKRK